MDELLFISTFFSEMGATPTKGILITMVWVLVGVSMILDYISGIRKARKAKVDTTSELMRRTTAKVVKNYGSLAFMVLFDIIIMSLGNLYQYEIIANVPITTMLMGAFIIYVEYRSFRENIDQKQRYKDNEALGEIGSILVTLKEMRDSGTADSIIELLKQFKKEKENETK